ncbi:hypothetical protein [Paenibacillus sp. N3.4]|uniref:hypothetical protein n=1 Tax=Paenibacillus sp. N3.4 TaxID=2603222 RepID=UPI0011CAE9F0|nr:hypothetical protein [Paenibacillus sp. N3.4]TXK84202.1 hypothetical protein FU659_10135 [Paenibacillus sp. N3.4]
MRVKKAMSEQCPVLYFYNLEDHCWGYSLFHGGICASSLHFSYEMEFELLMKVAEEMYPEQESIVEFLYGDVEGQKVHRDIESKMRDDAYLKEQLEKHFATNVVERFQLLGLDEKLIAELKDLLSVDTYFNVEIKHEIVELSCSLVT